jgi:hypothetical protein
VYRLVRSRALAHSLAPRGRGGSLGLLAPSRLSAPCLALCLAPRARGCLLGGARGCIGCNALCPTLRERFAHFRPPVRTGQLCPGAPRRVRHRVLRGHGEREKGQVVVANATPLISGARPRSAWIRGVGI